VYKRQNELNDSNNQLSKWAQMKGKKITSVAHL